MFSKRELLDAISECEKSPKTYSDCAKLATFYTLYDHLYSPENIAEAPVHQEQTVGTYGDSEFLKNVAGMKAEDAWKMMDNLMSQVLVLSPKLGEAIMRSISQTKLEEA